MVSRLSAMLMLCLAGLLVLHSLAEAEAWEVTLHNSLARILPDEPVPASDFLRLDAARGEYESVQIVVQAEANGALGEVRCRVGDLVHRGSGYRIGGADLRLYVQGYLQVAEPTWRGAGRAGRWPDPLLEYRPVDVPAGENRVFWLTVHVPVDAATGDYRSEVSVAVDGRVRHLPLYLRVRHFSLGRASHLQSYIFSNDGQFKAAYGRTDCLTPEQWRRCYDAWGEHRLGTDLWAAEWEMVKFYREPDGSYTLDIDPLLARIEYAARVWDCPALNIGGGCWGTSGILSAPHVFDRATAAPLSAEEHKLAGEQAGKLYFGRLHEWLEQQGLTERAYIQIWDEPDREAWHWGVRNGYRLVGDIAPWLRKLCVVGVHPYLQGYFDIWSPHTAFADKDLYRQVRQGISLYGPKAVPAVASASSTGGWGNAAFYKYAPDDAYDGCEYTKWAPAEAATPDQPQWLKLQLADPKELNGIRIVPYQSSHYQVKKVMMSLEVSTDGESFRPLALSPCGFREHEFSFAEGTYHAIRLVWHGWGQSFVPSGGQPVPPPQVTACGVREIELLGPDLPRESSLPREMTRRSEMWEYNVGADFPSFCVDPPGQAEHRAFPWRAWERGLTGILYYGGNLWTAEGLVSEEDNSAVARQPLVWRGREGNNGSAALFYPAREVGLLPSTRAERLRDGLEDYDYFWLLRELSQHAALLGEHDARPVQEARRLLASISGREVGDDPALLLGKRRQAAMLIDQLLPTR